MQRTQSAPCQTSLFAASVGIAAIMILAAVTASAESRVAQISGNVEIGRGEPPVWERLGPDTSIAANDRIRTGADGRVEITMDAGTLRVHENSLLRLPPAVGDADQVELKQGHSLFDVLRRAGRRFEVHTPTVVVSVKGTRFGVDADGDLGEVAVYRGMVGVREVGELDASMETLVREGFLATGGPGQAIELAVAPSGDPWASWQDFDRAGREARETPKRLNKVDRAKANFLRKTDKDVVRRAAQRKPEVAERLRRFQESQSQESEKKEASPAALATDDEDETQGFGRRTGRAGGEGRGQSDDASMRREARELLREVRQGIRQGEIAEDDLNSENGLESDDMAGSGDFLDDIFDWDAFEDGSPGELIAIAAARYDVQQQFQASAGGWTTEQIETALIDALVNNGMNPETAEDLIEDFLKGR